MINLAGLDRVAFADELALLNLPSWRCNQLWRWLYVHGARHFDDMSNIAKPLRLLLKDKFSLARPYVRRALRDKDGTRKWLIELDDGSQIESVFIPEARRGTLCVSSQVGCTLNCPFCHTGTQQWVRNLTAQEIIAQILIALDDLNGWRHISPLHRRHITNIVFMGMGEPLLNYDNIVKAIHIMRDEEGLAFSKRRITVSTAGVVPMIESLGRSSKVKLAISLHAPDDELRNELVPLNRKYPLAQLLKACRNYPRLSNARRITFEYVMLKDINDQDSRAHQLLKILRDIPSKINLIPFNPWRGSCYETSSMARIHSFAHILNEGGLSAPIRHPRGASIMAACGQLRSETSKAHVR